MTRGLLVFLAICTCAIAMSHRGRRAVNTEEFKETPNGTNVRVCERHTPCAWSVYEPLSKKIELNITNTYCNCGVGKICERDEDDRTSSAFVYRCREPGNSEKKPDDN